MLLVCKRVEARQGFFSLGQVTRLVGEDPRETCRRTEMSLRTLAKHGYIVHLARGKYGLTSQALSLLSEMERDWKPYEATLKTAAKLLK